MGVIIRKSDVEITFDSVELIENIINGQTTDLTEDEKIETVKRNIEHLEVVKGGNYIDLSQFTSAQLNQIDAIITAGNSYLVL